ncbi:MAG: ROK family protein [Chlamydiia bacterium]|nr:ROK family protein [Chlamydiia bacterium]
MKLLGIDIGGTKVSLSIGDESGTVFASRRIETKSLGTPEEGLPKIVEAIGHLLRDENIELKEIAGIGLAVPGPVSTKTERMLTPPNMPKWVDVPIVEYLRDALGRPIFMDNDANAGALGEWEFGEAKHVNCLVYLTMSTGMGGGIIMDGKLHQGATDTAGEVGHYILDPNGPKCFCGQRGCFEAFCGGASAAARLQENVACLSDSQVLKEAGGDLKSIDLQALLKAVKKSDPFAMEFWEDYIERLAQGIGILIQVLNPDAIILGTIASQNKTLVMGPLQQALPKYAWNVPLAHCRIEPSKLGKDLGKLGALALVIHGLKKNSSKKNF